MKFYKAIPILFFVFFNTLNSYGQALIPLKHDITIAVDRILNKKNCNVHTSIKPYLDDKTGAYVNLDSAILPGAKNIYHYQSYAMRKIFSESFLLLDSTNFYLAADPLFNFQYGKNFDYVNDYYQNTRGVLIRGKIFKKVYFQSSFYENQARFIDYVDKYIRHYGVAPGEILVKDFKGGAFDYGVAYGLISFSPNQHFNFQFGTDKNFIGDGYRSLLLSDAGFEYPFLKITTNYGILQYTNILTSFQNINRDSVISAPYTWYHGFQKKAGTFNYLSLNIKNRLEIGLFEGIIWQSGYDKNFKFDLNHYNPIILVNTIRNSFSNDYNTVLGLNLKYKITNTINVYGQLSVDDIDFKTIFSGGEKNKYGYQFGVKYFDIGGIKNFNTQIEYNQVQPYTYSFKDPLQSYTHYNQPLAHPLGANFREFVSFLNYRYKRFYFAAQFNYSQTGLDTLNSDWGQNIFKSESLAENGYDSQNNQLLQGVKTEILYGNISCSYVFNPKTNLCFTVGATLRKLNNEFSNTNSNYFYLGISTSLLNQYYDF